LEVVIILKEHLGVLLEEFLVFFHFFSLSFLHALKVLALHFGFPLEAQLLGELGLLEGILIELLHDLVVVSLSLLVLVFVHEVVVYDLDEFLEALVDYLG